MLLKLISWNVNGLRALAKKPEWEWLANTDASLVGIQETKASPEQLPEALAVRPGWYGYWDSSKVRKGYSGVGVYARKAPLSVEAELPSPQYKGEGRLLHLEYSGFHFFNGYFPNGGAAEVDENGALTGKFKRVPYKLGFLNEFLAIAVKCQKEKPVIICGDFNIAHEGIDLYSPVSNQTISGFLPEERAWMDKLVAAGFIDTFRHVHGDEPGKFTWWSYQRQARKKNQGWRLDYFFVSRSLAAAIKNAEIFGEITGSDHCPVGLELEMPADSF